MVVEFTEEDFQKEFMKSNWTLTNENGIDKYREPRTGILVAKHEAFEIVKTHLKEETRVIAAKCGSQEHTDLYNAFGPPLGALTNSWVTKTRNYRTTENISVWVKSVKEVEQFMSKAGHKGKAKAKSVTAVTTTTPSPS